MKNKRRMTAVIMVLVLVLCSAGAAFADIDYSQWDAQSVYPSDVRSTTYFTAVKSLIDRGILSGYEDGLFYPEKTINRAEFSKIITLASNNTGQLAAMQDKNIFTDLGGHDWAKGYINCAENAGIVNGYGDGTFRPYNDVTYLEAITAIIRTKSDGESFANSMGGWPNGYTKYAQMFNMMGDIAPGDWNSPATRGDIAKMVYRNMGKSTASPASGMTVSASGNPPTLTVFATVGSGTLQYQWYKNGVPVGVNSASYTVTGLPADGTTDTYYVIVTTKRTGYNDTSVTSKNVTVDHDGDVKK